LGFRAAIMAIQRAIIIIRMGTTGGRTILIPSRIHIITRAPDIMALESTTAIIAIIITTAIELK
jgi:hypothetical protein